MIYWIFRKTELFLDLFRKSFSVCVLCVRLLCCCATDAGSGFDSVFYTENSLGNEEGLIERERDGERERACFLRSAGKKLKLPRGRIMQPYASAGRRTLFIFLRFYVKSLCLKKSYTRPDLDANIVS